MRLEKTLPLIAAFSVFLLISTGCGASPEAPSDQTVPAAPATSTLPVENPISAHTVARAAARLG